MTSNNSSGRSIDSMFDQIKSNLEILGAIMALEYHDKNYLSGDDESRCRKQGEIVAQTHRLVHDLRMSMMVDAPKSARSENY